jgi:glucosylceramidase
MKATMLSNDFATAAPWSTYDDVVNDYTLESFSIERDLQQNGSLTFIKRAIDAGFEGQIQAYIDYPPDWMLDGDLPDNATLRSDCYDILAQYFANYVIAYANEGVVIDFLECFNEPFDSYTQMSPEQLATFLGDHIGPLFDELGLRPTTQLTYGGQCYRSNGYDFVTQVMSYANARKYMDVIAYHGYDCQFNCTDDRQHYDSIAELSQEYPSIPLWMTEICYAYNGDDPNCTSADTLQYCTDYPPDPTLAPPLPIFDFSDGPIWGHRIVKEMQSGVSGWIYWNLFLNTQGGPFLLSPDHNDGDGNYQHPLVIVDPDNETYFPTGAFWFLAHFSKYVRPNHVRIGTEFNENMPDEVSAVAFKSLDDDATVTLQIVNKASVDNTVTICVGTKSAEILVPALSIVTARW